MIVANSRWTAGLVGEVLTELGHRPGPPVRVVPLGTDPMRFRPGIDPAHFRREHALPAGRWLLTVARLQRYKGVDVAIEALRLLGERGHDLHYAVVGDGPARAELEGLARAARVDDRVHFLGPVLEAALPEAYALAEVYLGLTRQTEGDVEGFGIALVEAQAAGIPVVAGLGGGTGDAVRDGETGLLVDPEDPAAVAVAVDGLLRDPARRAAMGAAGRRAVEDYRFRDYLVPARSLVIMSPYVIHRDARWYPDPGRFDPDRWTPEFKAALPPFAYLPFGGGARRCIGLSLSKTLALAGRR